MPRSLLQDIARNLRLNLSLPFVSYEISFGDFLKGSDVDSRIARLGEIKTDLQASIVAIDALQAEARSRKHEVERLSTTVAKLQEDRATAETLLRVPQESFTRVLTAAAAKGRARGLVEGTIVGFLTGGTSSYLVWYLTN